MQIDRLFDIVYTLLSKDMITAKELSERYGVSSRTIYRDIDTLSIAGIPIYTSKGKGGGISLLNEFVLDKSVLSEKEQSEILYALQSLSVVKAEETKQVLQKLGTFWKRSVPDWISVDFTHWGFNDDKSFSMLKTAILENRLIQFDYYASNGEKTFRKVEPVQLRFKHKAWYIKGFCLERSDFRIFKLTRIKNIVVTDEIFIKRDISTSVIKQLPNNSVRPNITFVFKISNEMTYRIFDDFDESQITKNADGSFTVTATWPDDEWVYGFILSFGEYIEVISPEHAREIVIQKLQKTLYKYTYLD